MVDAPAAQAARWRAIARSAALASCRSAGSSATRSTAESWTAWLRQRSIARLRASIVMYERNDPRRSSKLRGRRQRWTKTSCTTSSAARSSASTERAMRSAVGRRSAYSSSKPATAFNTMIH